MDKVSIQPQGFVFITLPNVKQVQNVGKNKLSFLVSHYFKAMGTFMLQELISIKNLSTVIFLYIKITLYMYNRPRPQILEI